MGRKKFHSTGPREILKKAKVVINYLLLHPNFKFMDTSVLSFILRSNH